jgi:hypothetical protein
MAGSSFTRRSIFPLTHTSHQRSCAAMTHEQRNDDQAGTTGIDGGVPSLISYFTADELECAVRTLGELHDLRALDAHGEHLSAGQVRVAAKASARL